MLPEPLLQKKFEGQAMTAMTGRSPGFVQQQQAVAALAGEQKRKAEAEGLYENLEVPATDGLMPKPLPPPPPPPPPLPPF
uniref:Clathrin light chain n=1 Tax=Angiostrongylus cantonensis TaxID=6313 RepID=A0A0K0D4X7_ANGCA